MNELIAIVIIFGGGVLALLIFIKLISGAKKLTKKGLDVGVSKSVEVMDSLNSRIEKRQEDLLRRKLQEVVSEEIVRELTRQALRNGIEPDTYNVCQECKGHGCSSCSNQGWILKN